ncbi:DUF2264 domain-containing protein [Streptomyces radicis]|uniref:DUF2264 domain-containing protein n=1 Tax=Streptomyces radicis TaxID=1750517 RepID=A0A3A9WFZ0_9ACTN|nr:DUF2264 domain-containing protein [Streptomyces radicis]RKN11532.1 DUF2264 domain-containing protein [Streptomyces radicis]RKN26450.1 DUF2264 domain-containing protein [Streptomyces radicis]
MTDPLTRAPDRAFWTAAADRLLLAPRAHATERHAQIHLPGPASASGRWSDGLEGFARTFLLAGFRLGGAGGDDPHHLAEWYAEGLAAGTDPESPERWPTFAEVNQAKVEAASIAIALHETRPWIWDRLDDRVRGHVLTWLGHMVNTDMPGNNWVWFQGITEAFARTAGGRWDQADLDRAIELTDLWYAGDGWYSDGLTGGAHRNYDHYNGWAMHFYPLWFCRILGDTVGDVAPAGLADRYRARLTRYLDDHRHLTGGHGSPLIQGRSLTYRFAALAPVWAGALFDATPLPPGQTRRLAGLTLRHFVDNGAVGDDGLLPLGWHRPFPRIRQLYSGPASPYWASKGFAGLLLPPEHPVWTGPEVPLPVEEGSFTRVLNAPGWLVSGTRADGVVRVVNHGSDHTDPARLVADDPVYARLAYATHAAPEMPADPAPGPLDSTVTLVDARGRAAHRRPLARIEVAGHTGVSRSRAHWPVDATWDPFGGPEIEQRTGPWITVASVVRGPVEVRLARVDPGEDDLERGPFTLRFGGWPLTGPGGAAVSQGADAAASFTGAGGLVSAVVALRGLPHADVAMAKGSNALGPESATPLLTTGGDAPRPGALHAAAVVLGAGPLDPARLPTLAEGADPDTAVLSWPDGTTDTVRLPAPPGAPTPP